MRRHFFVEATLLGKEAHPLERGHIRLVSKQKRLPLIGTEHTKRHAQTGRLTCTIGPEKPDDGALWDRHGEVTHGSEISKLLGDRSHFQRH